MQCEVMAARVRDTGLQELQQHGDKVFADLGLCRAIVLIRSVNGPCFVGGKC